MTVVNPKPHLVQLTGPPVASAPTSMSAIEVTPEKDKERLIAVEKVSERRTQLISATCL